MKRREFLSAATVLAVPSIGHAQKIPVVGLLWNDSVKPSPYASVLSDALRTKGYVVGHNLRFEDAVALEGYAPMADNAARLVRTKVDLIVTIGATATLAAAKTTTDIPIVTVIGLDPVKGGVAKSLSRPGGNVTGVWTLQQGLNGKRVEILKQLVPTVSRIGILFAPGAAVQGVVGEAQAVAKALKIETTTAEVRSANEIEPAVAGLVKARVGAVLVGSSTFLVAHSERVVRVIAKHALPAIYGVERYIEAGDLLVYAPSNQKALGRAAHQIDRILKGARPAEIPIEQSSEVEFVINLKAARTQGITIPQAILQRADRAIQ